jgi:prepilin signal peptidase PulO-like enzyme (type II secretory pathway)
LAFALAVLAFSGDSNAGKGAVAAFTAAVLVLVTATDLERRIIPNRVVLPATVIVLMAHLVLAPGRAPVFLAAAAGAGIVFLIPNLISRSLMGMGDVKLAMFLGASLGLSVVGAVAVAFAGVFPFALGTVLRGGLAARKSTLPFGPFLAFGGLVILIVPRLVGS